MVFVILPHAGLPKGRRRLGRWGPAAIRPFLEPRTLAARVVALPAMHALRLRRKKDLDRIFKLGKLRSNVWNYEDEAEHNST
jgi:hypothetical protein